jgi:AbrB family looped-hinge helix DNA binding protein
MSYFRKSYFPMSDMVRVKRKGQVTLPAKVRSKYRIEEGDMLELKAEEGSITLRPRPLPEPGDPVGTEEQAKVLSGLKELRKKWR